ncbi:Phosphate-import ATP-binding protein PhnC [Thalassovita gelatinovora]|uniref:Phosphate-import ATP-binding protein PhnC n=1 Tax=Thalassovita gelatinovora TaxID=53501 RepID=A0A0P1FWL1_THAGE|nr:ATP-binding cassette domain-containing protein [Thalassovita gelatinovora]QIZ80059.1 ATP-binding cassette domain-containing protein [Thalassovita gelatinovora]CUH65464.1 Phosphate-import ATP-binding protein PhnC [Thalassovita gelatinovora]SER09262.1 phosphonate transport system ATP-binding protein [Thalassovita gelatinovora]
MLDHATNTQTADTTEQPQAAPLIMACGLTKSYDRRNMVLDGIDLRIWAGERVALIGSNGCGKSTLLKSLIGLHPISGGTLECFGNPVGAQSSRAQRLQMRRQTGFVFQKHCLVRRRTVLSNVIHGLYGDRGSWRAFSHSLAPEEWRARGLQALDEVDLADKAMRRADALSGGQQQRVAIARALVRRPQLLIADEPAASLDPVSGRNVMNLFSQLCRAHGITLLYTSHDMDHAIDYADRVIALKCGKVLFDRPAEKVTPADLKVTFDG